MKTLHSILRAPEGESSGGGSGLAEPIESHDSGDVDTLYGEPSRAAPEQKTETPTAKAAPEAAAKPTEKEVKLFNPFAKKTEEKPAAATEEHPEDKIQLSEKSGADTKTHFQTLKGIAKQEREARMALAAEIETLKKAAPSSATSPELERLRAEHKSLSDRLSIVDLQSHPDFVAKYVEPKNKIVAGINEVLTSNDIVGEDVSSLIGRPRAEFMKGAAAIADKLPDYERSAFMADMRQLQAMDAEAKGQLGKAGELSAALQRKSEETQRATFDATWKTLGFTAENLPPIEVSANASPEERASAEAYNKGISEIRSNAERIAFGRMSEGEVATSATKAAAFDFMQAHAIPKMEANFNEARQLIASLTEEVKALKAARGGGDGIGNVGSGDTGEDESHEAAASRAFSR